MSDFWSFDMETIREELRRTIDGARKVAIANGAKVHPRVEDIKESASANHMKGEA